jgi:4-oxalocrotonate tautomerase
LTRRRGAPTGQSAKNLQARGGHMPYVRIEITDGATYEQKLQIYKETTEMGTSVALIREREAKERAAAQAATKKKPATKRAAAEAKAPAKRGGSRKA